MPIRSQVVIILMIISVHFLMSSTAAANNQPVSIEPDINEEIPIQYICSHCATVTNLKPQSNVRCTACGNRILYKMRQRRLMIFDAR